VVVPWTRQLIAFGDPLVPARTTARCPAKGGSPIRHLGGRSARDRPDRRDGAELHLGAANSKRLLVAGQARGVPLLTSARTRPPTTETGAVANRLLAAGQDREPDYLF